MARGNDLVYGADDEPGIRRRGRSRFRYVDDVTGEDVRDQRVLDRIAALAVPPAWTDVWISRRPRGHVQATGRDARGRKQYRYHADYRARREQEKFADLVPFGEALGDLRTRIRADLGRRDWDLEHGVALVLGLLDTTLVRVGNEGYAKENKTFGLTTLRKRHVRDEGGVRLCFVGKGGREHEVCIGDRRLVAQVRRCRQFPGQQLFQWLDDDGGRHPVTSTDVNERLRELTGLDVTAKTFRTWGASVHAATLLAAEDPPSSQREANRAVVEVVDDVADTLGNTRAVARASYVHPLVVQSFEAGRLAEWWDAGPSRSKANLEPEERKLLHVLRKAKRARL